MGKERFDGRKLGEMLGTIGYIMGGMSIGALLALWDISRGYPIWIIQDIGLLFLVGFIMIRIIKWYLEV